LTWIVTGGAGYIGAHVVHLLRERHEVVVFDDLSAGRRERLPEDVPFVRGSVTDRDALDRLFERYPPSGVIHLAARKVTSDSVHQPELYAVVNVTGLENVVAAMRQAGVQRLLFASSAAVYGDSGSAPVHEDHPLLPVNPYGDTKRRAEEVIDGAGAGLRALTFRQFNVVGAGTHPWAVDLTSTCLLPAAFQALTGGPELVVRGRYFGTPDGTAVRDYVHLTDVAEAYVRGVDQLSRPSADRHRVVNLGSGTGTSVTQLVEIVGAVTGRRVPHHDGQERKGDAAEVIAAVDRARAMGFGCARSLHDAVASAWASWQRYVSR
jgi:UDP-glucose 4-epimerase